ncbi:MAG: HD-GYP domain-containing protein [Dermatophilaceae bacterium]|nr:HD domain-containing protein [Intrasporangiaceae bacterium]
MGAWGYIALVCVVGALLFVLGQRVSPLTKDDVVPLVALLLLGLLAHALPEAIVSLSGDGVRFSFFGIIILAAAAMTGPLGAAAVGAVVTMVRPVRSPAIRRIFNSVMFCVVGLVGGLAYFAVGGADPLTVSGPSAVVIQIGIPLVVADLAQAAANAIILSGMMTVTAGVPFSVYVRGLLTSTGAAYVGYGVVAFLLVVLWGPAQIGWFSAVLIIVPLLVAWWVFGQFGAELEAHERTTATLVAALEVRHPGAAAHSQRVAILCDWIGESLRFGPKVLVELRTAGLLHDVGLLGVRDGDLGDVRDHPVVGVRMLDGISFAVPALPAIAAHHERMDGSGYPRGMIGSDIPLGARVIAVADSFDALTTGTAEHPPVAPRTALRRLAEDRGLDPDVVAALERAAERHGVLEASGQDWLRRAKFGEGARAESDAGPFLSMATMAIRSAELAIAASQATWITRHDHPQDRLGL